MAHDLTPEQASALRLDDRVVRVARGQGALELALGRTLLALFAGDRLLQLGYARRKDYAVERLGVPARTMFAWVELARALQTRPLLCRAVAAGRVSPRKAREVLAAAVGDQEVYWTAAAERCTLAELSTMLRGQGHDPPRAFEVETLTLAMTAPQQDRFDAAIALAREELGAAAPRWQCVEAVCQEWLGAFGAWAPEDTGLPDRAVPDRAVPDRTVSALAAVDEALVVIDSEPGRSDVRSLQERVDRLMAARTEFDAVFGALVEELIAARAWLTLGYESLDEYSRERLGMSARTVRQRAWLERRLCALPELREALTAGRVTYSKALLIAKDATPINVADRIADAESTTWQQLERDCTEEEDRQNRAAGVRRIWGPQDAARTVVDAIACAQAWSEAVCGQRMDAGEALAVVADHFVEVWSARPQATPARRRRILERERGVCAVPGCSRPAEHVHHIVFRSRGGGDDDWNRIGVCVPHHLHGLHRGYLKVRGRAGEQLVWTLGACDAEVWITKGGGDVRRAG